MCLVTAIACWNYEGRNVPTAQNSLSNTKYDVLGVQTPVSTCRSWCEQINVIQLREGALTQVIFVCISILGIEYKWHTQDPLKR
jgi:hypothetical protein